MIFIIIFIFCIIIIVYLFITLLSHVLTSDSPYTHKYFPLYSQVLPQVVLTNTSPRTHEYFPLYSRVLPFILTSTSPRTHEYFSYSQVLPLVLTGTSPRRTHKWVSLLNSNFCPSSRCRWIAMFGTRQTGRSTSTRRCSMRSPAWTRQRRRRHEHQQGPKTPPLFLLPPPRLCRGVLRLRFAINICLVVKNLRLTRTQSRDVFLGVNSKSKSCPLRASRFKRFPDPPLPSPTTPCPTVLLLGGLAHKYVSIPTPGCGSAPEHRYLRRGSCGCRRCRTLTRTKTRPAILRSRSSHECHVPPP